MEAVFNRHGFVMILLSWVLPILPDVTACLSGFIRMPFWKLLLAWALGVYSYVTIAAYAAIGLPAFFWLSWMGFLWFG